MDSSKRTRRLCLLPAFLVDPFSYLDPWEARLALRGYNGVNATSLRLGVYEDLKRESVDPYQLMHDIYEQNRQKKIDGTIARCCSARKKP